MKLYTNESQTAKLIELGFEKLKNERWVLDIVNESTPSIQNVVKRQDYSIGELIEMLDNISNNHWDFTRTSERIIRVEVHILPKTKRDKYFYRVSHRKELIDALYDMVVKLKEEGVI